MDTRLPRPLRLPEETRRLRLHRFQWIAIPLVFLTPVLAILGVFDEKRATASASARGLALAVEYPVRERYSQNTAIRVSVRNTSAQPHANVRIRLDAGYAEAFSDPVFLPGTAGPFTVDLAGLDPGERRDVWIELRGERYGSRAGRLAAFTTEGNDTASVTLRTFILP